MDLGSCSSHNIPHGACWGKRSFAIESLRTVECLRILWHLLHVLSLFRVNLIGNFAEFLCLIIDLSRLNYYFQLVSCRDLICTIVRWSRVALIFHDPIV